MSVLNHPEALRAISWWTDLDNLHKGQPMGPFVPDRTIYTDASLSAWGAHSEDASFQVSGLWPPGLSSLSINQLELKAVILALRQAPDDWHDCRLLIASDNTTVVAYNTRAVPSQLSCWI